MNHIKLFENYGKSYHAFKPKAGVSYPTSRYPTDRYSEAEAKKLFYDSNPNIKPYDFDYSIYTEEPYKTQEFDERGQDSFIDWLRDEKGYDRSNSDIQYEYSAQELDHLYDEYSNSGYEN